MSGTGLASNLQTAAIATFVDMSTIAGLGIINYTATMGKMMIYPVFAQSGIFGGAVLACVDGAHDLARWYFIGANAVMSSKASGTTGAG